MENTSHLISIEKSAKTAKKNSHFKNLGKEKEVSPLIEEENILKHNNMKKNNKDITISLDVDDKEELSNLLETEQIKLDILLTQQKIKELKFKNNAVETLTSVTEMSQTKSASTMQEKAQEVIAKPNEVREINVAPTQPSLASPVKIKRKFPIFLLFHIILFPILFFSIYLLLTTAFVMGFLMGAIISGVFATLIEVASVWIFSKLRKVNHPIPNIKNGSQLLLSEQPEEKICPKCSTKLNKSKLLQEGNVMSQVIKCNNPTCTYTRKLEYSV